MTAGREPVSSASAGGQLPTPHPPAANALLSTTSRAAAVLVAGGILLSRLAGLVRQRVLAHYLGLTGVADAWSAAFRIPNLLQNLFGEGALSASFIPAYARRLAAGDTDGARRLAGAVGAVLGLVVAFLVLGGVLAAPVLLDLIAPGFAGERRELTLRLVRIFFPGAGLLVLSAWCLGILNSHGRFFLSYAAPVVWNAAIVAALLLGPESSAERIAVWGAWGAVAGSALQFLVQLPTVLSLVRGLRLRIAPGDPGVAEVGRNFAPALVSRGVVQISAYIDTLIASLLPIGAVAAVLNAQMLYTLPVSLFGISISAAELPAMSADAGAGPERSEALRARVDQAVRRLAYFVIPSAVAFLVLGGEIAAAIFQGGAFTAADARYVWWILAGSSIGLLAATGARVVASAFYALQDTRTPLRTATIRVTLSTALALVGALVLPGRLGFDPALGAVALTLAGALAGWVEYLLLRRALARRIGPSPALTGRVVLLTALAGLGGAAGWLSLALVQGAGPIPRALVACAAFAIVYGAVTLAAGIPEARAIASRVGLRLP